MKNILDCVDSKTKFRFARRGNRGRQFIHPSGTLFVRVLTDLNESSILIVFGNTIYMKGAGKEGSRLFKEHENAYQSLVQIIEGLERGNSKSGETESDRVNYYSQKDLS